MEYIWKNKVNGITLIALVITIIILLILAGIGISALTQTGLMSKTKIAKEKTEYTSAKEKIQIEIMAAQTQNYSNQNENILITITKHMIDIENITVNKIYFSKTSKIDKELQNQFNDNNSINGIVVSVNEYSKYKFLIGENGNIEGVTINDVDSMSQEEFEKIKDFESKLGYLEKKEEINENLDIKITDINQDGYTVNVINNYPESMDVKYEYYIDSTKKTEKIKDKKYVINDPVSDHRISVVAYSGDKVLKSKDIIFKAPYKVVPYLDSNTESIINNGFLEDYTGKWGHSTLFHAFDNNIETYASTNKVGDDAIGSYIGYDFGKNVEVSKVDGKIRMREYIIQYSDDKENWKDAVTGDSNSSNSGDKFSNNISTDIGKHRYWRLYVKNGCKSSDWSAFVYSLQFYIKEDDTNNMYIGQIPYLESNTEIIMNNGFHEDSTSKWGHSALFQAFDNNIETYASTNKVGDDAIGSYIGYDFGKNVEVSRVTGKIRMREYIIQYSDDKENWKDAVNGKSNSSNSGDNFSNNISTDIGQHRYWRLYVKNGCSSSDWSAFVYSLQFYYTK